MVSTGTLGRRLPLQRAQPHVQIRPSFALQNIAGCATLSVSQIGLGPMLDQQLHCLSDEGLLLEAVLGIAKTITMRNVSIVAILVPIPGGIAAGLLLLYMPGHGAQDKMQG